MDLFQAFFTTAKYMKINVKLPFMRARAHEISFRYIYPLTPMIPAPKKALKIAPTARSYQGGCRAVGAGRYSPLFDPHPEASRNQRLKDLIKGSFASILVATTTLFPRS